MSKKTLAPLLLILTILTMEFRGSWSEITVSLRFLTYKNTYRCDRYSDCDFTFVICLRGPGLSVGPQCFHTETFYNQNPITFTDDMQSVPNPVLVDFPDGAEVGLRVHVTEIDTRRNNDWDEFLLPISTRLMPTTKRIPMIGQYRRKTILTIDLSMYCTRPFYADGDTCSKFCKERNNDSGHYTCNTNGDKDCLPGWFNPLLNCTTHLESCQITHCQNGGTCLSNGVCSCYMGYTGTDCSEELDDECLDCNQENTASCEILVGSLICHCNSGYTGNQCETPATESPTTDEQVGSHSPKNLGLPIGLFIGLLLLIIIVIILIVFVIRWRKKKMTKETDASGTATLGMERGPHSTESNEAHSNPYIMDESTFTNNNLQHEAERGTLPTHGIHPTTTSHTGVPALPPYRVNEIPGPRDGLFLVENGNYESTANIGRNTYDNIGMR